MNLVEPPVSGNRPVLFQSRGGFSLRRDVRVAKPATRLRYRRTPQGLSSLGSSCSKRLTRNGDRSTGGSPPATSVAMSRPV